MENCSVIRLIKISNSFWKPWMLSTVDWRGEEPSSLLSADSSKTCISGGMRLHWCLWHGQLTHLERKHQCWRLNRGFWAICSHPDNVSFREGLAYFSETMVNQIPHPSRQHGVAQARCWTGLQSRPFTNWKHLVRHKMKNPATRAQDCWAARILDQSRMGQHYKTPRLGNWSPHFQDVDRQMSKEEGMLHNNKHHSVTAF